MAYDMPYANTTWEGPTPFRSTIKRLIESGVKYSITQYDRVQIIRIPRASDRKKAGIKKDKLFFTPEGFSWFENPEDPEI